MSEATDNAIPIEVRKIGYRQSTKDGMIVSFAVHPDDMPSALAAAQLGTRYMCALVEIGDDEKPVPLKEKRSWSDLPPASQAAIRCGEKPFQKFLGVHNEEFAAKAVRENCGVASRSQLTTDPVAGKKWEAMDSKYQAWMRVG